jgi:hypothetical protein
LYIFAHNRGHFSALVIFNSIQVKPNWPSLKNARCARTTFALVLLGVFCSTQFLVPVLGSKIWHHHHRMWFKKEAVSYYKDRPELFVEFTADSVFENDIRILKPQKEFSFNGLKYDILDTLERAYPMQILCVQDADENALAELIEACTSPDRNDPHNIPMSDWYKIFRSASLPSFSFATDHYTDCLHHHCNWKAPVSMWDRDIPHPPPLKGRTHC